jgi:molybdopterin synthase sulfur carrier subunit
MKVEVRYFAAVREALGPGEAVDVPAGSDIAAVRRLLAARGGRHGEALGTGRVLRSARNRVLSADDTAVAEGDEIGFFPPLTGG